MCVIIIKEKGVDVPSKDFLKKAFNTNSHGAGYATDKGKFFKTLSFETFYTHLKNNVKKGDACIIHFRLATHGSIKASNCHPFKGKAKGVGDVFFAHNGILDIKSRKNKTDSELCFRHILLPIMNATGGYSESLDIAVEGVIGSSKFCMVDKSGVVHKWGQWIKHDGLLLSNTRFLDSYVIPSRHFGGSLASVYEDVYEDDYADFYSWLNDHK